MYYLKYNDVDLTDIVKIRNVEVSSLPISEHSTISVFERSGDIFNGSTYSKRDIKLKFLIQTDNNEDYEEYIGDVKRAFYTRDEAILYCGDDTLYMWCVPEGEVTIKELGTWCSECEVNLISYSPYWHSTEIQMTESNSKVFIVENNGDVATYPMIDIGVESDTSFLQITNRANKGTILLGSIPTVGNITKKATEVNVRDECESTSGWVSSSATLDSGMSGGGTLAVTESGSGICCADFGSSSSEATWHGCSYRKNLTAALTDFKVRVTMKHNSTGKNGDPTKQTPYSNDTSVATSGKKSTFYQVNVSSLNVRSGAGTRYKKIGSVKKGYKIKNYTLSKGWLKFTYNSKTAYVYASYCKKMVGDSTVTANQCNFVTAKPTAIRSTASKSAKNKKTIPVGTCIRCVTSTKYPTTGSANAKGKFYKLAKSYGGQTGYVYIDNLVKASEYTIEYEEMYELADDKTGICTLFGYSSDGTQLFSMNMIDDNDYYEFTYPLIRKNGSDFLKDKTKAPTPKIVTEYSESNSELTSTKKYGLSGKYGDWNEFYGDLYIERVNNKWYAYVSKKKDGKVVKTIKTKIITDKTNSSKQLSYLVVYMGTSGSVEKASGMAINLVEIKSQIKNTSNVNNNNWKEFEAGDEVTIDCNIPMVYLNGDEFPALIDIGSDFFKLEPGDNQMAITTDDIAPSTTVIFAEQFL